jgi:hypothetical protein
MVRWSRSSCERCNAGQGVHTRTQRRPREHFEAEEQPHLRAAPGLSIPKQPSQGGAGGNPLVYFQFTDDGGKALSGEFLLGRCTQIGE